MRAFSVKDTPAIGQDAILKYAETAHTAFFIHAKAEITDALTRSMCPVKNVINVKGFRPIRLPARIIRRVHIVQRKIALLINELKYLTVMIMRITKILWTTGTAICRTEVMLKIIGKTGKGGKVYG